MTTENKTQLNQTINNMLIMNTILKHITSRATRIGAMACSLCVGLPAMAQDGAVAEAAEEASSVSAVDTIWVLLAAMLVFFMQPGFALVL